MNFKPFASLLIILLLFIFLIPSLAWSGEFTAFGPQSYTREPGPPITLTNNFSVLNPNTEFSLRVYNGGLEDTEAELISSMVISLNGTKVVWPQEFNQKVTFIEKELTLRPDNTIEVEVRGKPGRLLTVHIVGIDNEAPNIQIIKPLNASLTNTNPYDIRLGFSDGISGINTNSLKISINDIDKTSSFNITTTGFSGSASGDILLPEGTNIIKAGISDFAGNTSTASTSFTVDTTPPQINITSPIDNAIFTTTPITVTGTVTDNLDNNPTVTVNGEEATVTGETFSVDNITLTPGSNSITATAENAAGNTSFCSTTVIYTVTPDTTKPIKPIVFDEGEYINSTTELYAHWLSADPETNIIDNQYSIGTTPGETNIVNWTSVGTDTEVTHTGLYLVHNQTYYFNVKAKNQADLWSDITSSDGITVNAHLPVINTITPEDNSTFFTKTELIIRVDAQDEDNDPLEYRFLIDDKVEKDWTSYSDEATLSWMIYPTTSLTRKITCEVRDDKQSQASQIVNYLVEIDTNDTTPPTAPEVITSEYSNSLNRLSASWTSEDYETGILEFQYAIYTNPCIVDWTSAGTNTSITHYGLELTEGQDYYFLVRAINRVGLTSPETQSQNTNATKEVIIKITSPQDNSLITENEFTIRGIATSPEGVINQITINNKPISVNSDGTFQGPTLVAPGYAKRKGITESDSNYIIMSYPGSTTITAEAGGQAHSIKVYCYRLFVNKDVSGHAGGFSLQSQTWNNDILTECSFSDWREPDYRSKHGYSDEGSAWAYRYNDDEMSAWGYYYLDVCYNTFGDPPTRVNYATKLTIHTLPKIEEKLQPMILIFKDCDFNSIPGSPMDIDVNLSQYKVNGQSLKVLYGGEDFCHYFYTPNALYAVLTDYQPGKNMELQITAPTYNLTDPNITYRCFAFKGMDMLRTDLIIDGMAENEEENPGGYATINNDDDNNNNVPDKDEYGIIAGEDDLVAISLSTGTTSLNVGQVTLEATAGSNKIKIWETPVKETQVTLPRTWDLSSDTMPRVLYVEGIEVSDSARDVELKLSYSIDGSSFALDDKVRVTVVGVELGFQNSKMSSPKVIDPQDSPKDVRIGVIKEDSITFKAILTPDITLKNEQYNWSGEKPGIGPEISVIFDTTSDRNEFLAVLGTTKLATTTVIYVPSPNETSWGITHPVETSIIFFFLKPEAESWVNANAGLIGGGLHNERADAARHAYWNVIMTVDLDAATAEGAATAHERTNLEQGGPHNEIVMDMENNAHGRSIAGGLPPDPNRTTCQNAVISALNTGTLTILDDLTNSNEIGLLQPSNQ